MLKEWKDINVWGKVALCFFGFFLLLLGLVLGLGQFIVTADARAWVMIAIWGLGLATMACSILWVLREI